MHRRLIFALVLLVGLPLLGLAGLAFKIASDEREMAAMQWRALLEDRLQDVANGVAAQTAAIEREVLSALDRAPPTTEGLRQLVRRTPLITQVFWLQQGGQLVFPPPDATQSASERAFMERTQQIWRRQA
ncbi:MAG: hypothetical protein AAFN74_10285, partial [Myxococcota bacterium]